MENIRFSSIVVNLVIRSSILYAIYTPSINETDNNSSIINIYNSPNSTDITNNVTATSGLLISNESALNSLHGEVYRRGADITEDLCQNVDLQECILKDCQWVEGQCEEKKFSKTIRNPFPRPVPATPREFADLCVILWDHPPSHGNAVFWLSYLAVSCAIIILLALALLSFLGWLTISCCKRRFCHTQNEKQENAGLTIFLPHTRKFPMDDYVINNTDSQTCTPRVPKRLAYTRGEYLIKDFIETTRAMRAKSTGFPVATKKEDLENPPWPFAPTPEEDEEETNNIQTATISRCPRFATFAKESGTSINGNDSCGNKALGMSSELIVETVPADDIADNDEELGSIAKFDFEKTMYANENNEDNSTGTTMEGYENGSSGTVTENNENYSPADSSFDGTTDSNKANHHYEEIAHCSHSPSGNIEEVTRKNVVMLQSFQAKLKKTSPPQLPHQNHDMQRMCVQEEQESTM